MTIFPLDNAWATVRDPDTNNTTMHWAVISGSLMVLNRIIRAKILSPHELNDNGRTALHMAAIFDRAELALRLIENDANVFKTDLAGKTPLQCACESKSIRTAVILIEAGAPVEIPDLPRTELMFEALRSRKLQAVKQLIPDDLYELHAADKSGKTIAEVAAECGLTEYLLSTAGL